jgi:hypothetical protein
MTAVRIESTSDGDLAPEDRCGDLHARRGKRRTLLPLRRRCSYSGRESTEGEEHREEPPDDHRTAGSTMSVSPSTSRTTTSAPLEIAVSERAPQISPPTFT